MATGLRRRFVNLFTTTPSPSPSVPETPTLQASDDEAKEKDKPIRLVPVSQYQQIPPKRRSKRRNGLIFGLGGIFGIFVALFFAKQNEVISFEALADLNLESLMDVIPAGIVKDASEFSVCAFSSKRKKGYAYFHWKRKIYYL